MRFRKTLTAAIATASVAAIAACGSDSAATSPTVVATEPTTTQTPVASLISGAQNFTVAFSEKDRVQSPSAPDADLHELVSGNNRFATDLYRQLADDEDGNMFMSPYSISLALAMTYAGARGNTGDEMSDALHFALEPDQLHAAFNAVDQALASRGADLPADEKFILEIANSIWGQQGFEFEQEFLDTLAENYGAGMRLVDYMNNYEEARQVINDWVEDNTNDRIEDLLPEDSIDEMTRLVLVNAIFFKASWETQFDPRNTAEGNFHLLNGSTVTADMMSLDAQFGFAEGDDYTAVELPYVGGETSMVVVMPDEGEFAEFENSLDADVFEEIFGGIADQRINLKMPKFEFESKFSLPDQLKALGMEDAFTWLAADFSGIHQPPPELYVKEVIHQSFVSVDETGTEAAAATGVVIGFESLPPSVTVDRPFIFLIRDVETNTVLFLGRVMDPTA